VQHDDRESIAALNAARAHARGIDVGVVDCVQIANALIHGFATAAFAGGCTYSKASPTLVLITVKSGPIRTARDLEGQAITVPSAKSLSSSMTTEWLRVNGADPDKVKVTRWLSRR
jgi:ABC-type nitrate/sulfonate/bicarbonate transport system substrate-binding protein